MPTAEVAIAMAQYRYALRPPSVCVERRAAEDSSGTIAVLLMVLVLLFVGFVSHALKPTRVGDR